MHWGGRVAIAVAICLAAVLTGTTAVSAAEGTPLGHPEDVEADEIRLDVTLADDGSAAWQIEFWVWLDDTDRETAFAELEDEIAENPDEPLTDFRTRMDATVVDASEATDREMAAREYKVDTVRQQIPTEYGVVRYTFSWDGFAAVDGQEITAGDAIDGFFLEDGTRLRVDWPEDYELQAVSPEPDTTRETAVIWRGSQTEFASGEPRVTVAPQGGIQSWQFGVGAGLFALLVAGGVTWWRRHSGSAASESRAGSTAADSATTAESSAAEPAGARTDGATSDQDSRAAGQSSELLSNEEQVLRLLEANGGRMKQQAVVRELEWSDAKTSKVVRKLRENSEIESFRIGRENVLTLGNDEDRSLE